MASRDAAGKATLAVVAGMDRPNIEEARRLIDLCKATGCAERVGNALLEYVEAEKESGARKAEATKAANEASSMWQRVKTEASRADDLVDMADEKTKKKEQKQIEKKKAKEAANTVEVVKTYESPRFADNCHCAIVIAKAPDGTFRYGLDLVVGNEALKLEAKADGESFPSLQLAGNAAVLRADDLIGAENTPKAPKKLRDTIAHLDVWMGETSDEIEGYSTEVPNEQPGGDAASQGASADKAA